MLAELSDFCLCAMYEHCVIELVTLHVLLYVSSHTKGCCNKIKSYMYVCVCIQAANESNM